MYYDIEAYDMLHSEFRKMCRKDWSEGYNELCIDLTKKKIDGKDRIFSESINNIN